MTNNPYKCLEKRSVLKGLFIYTAFNSLILLILIVQLEITIDQ